MRHVRLTDPPADTALQDFSRCHVGFVTVLETALGLPEMIVSAARSRSCAADMLKMFRHRFLAHHDDEERDLCPAVLKVAQPGVEADRARVMVAQLVREHREIAQLWKELEPAVLSCETGHRRGDFLTDQMTGSGRGYHFTAASESSRPQQMRID